jgi:hypothetical protein
MNHQFLLRIYIAAPGTPYIKEGQPPTISAVGHMWYSVQEVGGALTSYGFAPITHGQPNGPGEIIRDDVKCYQNPLFTRVMEITEPQFDALKDFGGLPQKNGFSLHYADVRHNCVDFTWGALKKSKVSRAWRIYEGALRPTQNIGVVRGIDNVIKNSSFNQELTNLLPPQTPLQRLLTENKSAPKMRAA